nr:cadmium-translocating P-type ATPase [Leptotrichiaceae bacterium]
STFDTSTLTGESIPRDIISGDEVLSGYINISSLITIKVSKPFYESTISKILDLVENATSKKSKTEQFITKFARYYTPSVVIIALIIAFIPPFIVQNTTFSEWFYRALVFLVISCPCALVISIPLGFFGGIGSASKHGILIKGANYLEALNNVDTIVMDKTGTLTKGIFKVTEINLSNNLKENFTKNKLLKYVAHAESFSNHPIAKSIVNEYEKDGNIIDKNILTDFKEISGYGVKVKIEEDNIVVGNLQLMKLENILLDEKESLGTTVYIGINGNYIGNILIADEIKEDSASAIINMKDNGIKNITMLTGDTKNIGESIAKKLNIDKVYAELLPHQKVEKLEDIFKENNNNKNKIAFVGDGINDAPVLARADIGIAMGGLGSDAAIEAADIVIMNDEPSKIVTSIKIAKNTRKIVWQNITFTLIIKIIVLILGAGGIASIWEAVFADVGVALLAILNATRIIKKKFD